MTRAQLISEIRRKQSFLCVGLDPDREKLPKAFQGDPDSVVSFSKAIIEATSEFCVAYKLNIAFFEALGKKGWDVLFKTRELLPENCFLIADAKRADIGNSSSMYARAFFDELKFDAVTVAPYMGEDSVRPFLEYKDKWTILLALTSNPGARDFQMQSDAQGEALFERVLTTAQTWGSPNNLMFVAGATQTDYLKRVRNIAPDSFLLVPGIGAQGGSLRDVVKSCMTTDCGILVNSTRDIIYASKEDDFVEKAGERAKQYQQEMSAFL